MGAILTIRTRKEEEERERERVNEGDYAGPISIWHAILFTCSEDKLIDQWSADTDTGNSVH